MEYFPSIGADLVVAIKCMFNVSDNGECKHIAL